MDLGREPMDAKVRIGVSGASAMARQGRDTFFRYLEVLEGQGWDSLWFLKLVLVIG